MDPELRLGGHEKPESAFPGMKRVTARFGVFLAADLDTGKVALEEDCAVLMQAGSGLLGSVVAQS
jgi:hypothetical protein